MPSKEKLPEGFSAIWPELEKSFTDSADLAGSGSQQFADGVTRIDPLANLYRVIKGQNSDTSYLAGVGDVLAGFGKAGLGAAGAAFSPVDATVRSFVGNPVENSTGLPSGFTSFLAELAMPEVWAKASKALEGLDDLSKINRFDAGFGAASSEVRQPKA